MPTWPVPACCLSRAYALCPLTVVWQLLCSSKDHLSSCLWTFNSINHCGHWWRPSHADQELGTEGIQAGQRGLGSQWVSSLVEGQVVSGSRCDPCTRGHHTLGCTFSVSHAEDAATPAPASPGLSILSPHLHCPGHLGSKHPQPLLFVELSAMSGGHRGSTFEESPAGLSLSSCGHRPAAVLSPQWRKARAPGQSLSP